MSIFKACDIRGAYPAELDEALFGALGRAIGSLLRERHPRPEVLVAGDVRLSTPPLRQALAEGLASTGCRVADLGMAPTPVAYFAARRLRPHGLAIVTASHNPPGDNGLKLAFGELPITESDIERVERAIAEQRFATGHGSIRPLAIEDDYAAWLAHSARPGNGLRIVLDCGNGTYSALAPRVLRALGYQAIELFCTPDGRFPNRSPNPSAPGSLAALCAAVAAHRAAIGVALDGDGDRVAVVDDSARPLTGDQAIILLAQHILALQSSSSLVPRPHKVVLDIKCSKAVLDAITAFGAQPLLERSGHAFIRARMRAEDALFGGELSGHFFYRELEGGDDGLYSILRLAELANAAPEAISALVDAMPHYATTPDIRVPYPAPDGPSRIEQIAQAATGQVLRLDGVRVTYPDGWGLARCSVTEPVLTFRFEAFEGHPRAIAQRLLAPTPDLCQAVLNRLDQPETPEP